MEEEIKEEVKTCAICGEKFSVKEVIWSKTVEKEDICEYCYDAILN